MKQRLYLIYKTVKPDFFFIAACTVFFSYWNSVSIGFFSKRSFVVFLAINVVSAISGRMITSKLAAGTNIPFRFLIGFLSVNTALFVFSVVSPFAIYINFLVIAFAVLFFALRQPDAPFEKFDPHILASVIISLMIIAVWNWYTLDPVKFTSDGWVVFSPNRDSFIHASTIRALRDARGLWTFDNVYLSGHPGAVYHYASYGFPALLSSVTHTSCYQAYLSFLTPAGMFLASLSAYSLINLWWGRWPAMAASVFLLLLPDAAFQGFQNYNLSFFWLAQISPTLLYGISAITIAWIFVFTGCDKKSYRMVFVGYIIALLSMAYKAHIFVANAFLLLIFPALFMDGQSKFRRAVWFIGGVLIYASAMFASARSGSLPAIKYDGSYFYGYMNTVISNIEDAGLKGAMTGLLSKNVFQDAAVSIAALLFFTFGIYWLIYALLLKKIFSHNRPSSALFPILAIANYLFMSLMLAKNLNIGTIDEFNHRPFVWAYFIVVVSLVGAVYRMFFKDKAPSKKMHMAYSAVFFIALLYLPTHLNKDIQTGPLWTQRAVNHKIPKDVYDSALFIKGHAGKGDIVLDSYNDYLLYISALSERQAFISGHIYLVPQKYKDAHNLRRGELMAIKKSAEVSEVLGYMKKNNIKWFIKQPNDKLSWPEEMSRFVAFGSGGAKIYRFD